MSKVQVVPCQGIGCFLCFSRFLLSLCVLTCPYPVLGILTEGLMTGCASKCPIHHLWSGSGSSLPSQSSEASHAAHPKAGLSCLLDKCHYLLCLTPNPLNLLHKEQQPPPPKLGIEESCPKIPVSLVGLAFPQRRKSQVYISLGGKGN